MDTKRENLIIIGAFFLCIMILVFISMSPSQKTSEPQVLNPFQVRKLSLQTQKDVPGDSDKEDAGYFEDNGNILGIKPDNFPNTDKYMLHANNLLRQCIGAEYLQLLSFSLKSISDKQVLCIQCLPSQEPVFLKRQDSEEFYIRVGPGSRKLTSREVLSYVQNRQK